MLEHCICWTSSKLSIAKFVLNVKEVITLLNMVKNIMTEDTTMHIMLNTIFASYKIFL
jgi:hypothetical protein